MVTQRRGEDGGMEVHREPTDPKGEEKCASRESQEEEAKRGRLYPPED